MSGGSGGSGGSDGRGGEAAAKAAGASSAADAGAAACPPAILRALAAHTTMTLAYVDEDGPQACAVLYAADAVGPALYFVTATTTRHGRALAEPGARVAFTAQRDGQEWSGLTGLQGRGRCRALAGADRATAWHTYTERFPFVAGSDRLRAALERTTLWELRPDWLRLIDNGQGFGHKEEWQRPEVP
ncbi:pyridoxamine 5'-phosphate oxidase family protein [Streptomyces sp. NPDC002446]